MTQNSFLLFLNMLTSQFSGRILTIHHLSTSGGTVISKCIAVQPNIVLLSENNPLTLREIHFNPFDPTQQFLVNYPEVAGDSPERRKAIFLDRIREINGKCLQQGKQLVIRDHSHSDFLWDEPRPEKSPLLNCLKKKYFVRSIVTLRNPIDAFLSMIPRNWHRGVKTFDEYCRRVLMFLDTYSELPIFHYENFVIYPQKTIENICDYLAIEFDANFIKKFHTIKLTGDSGRGVNDSLIGSKPMREFDQTFRQEVLQSSYYAQLSDRFGYERDPAEHALNQARLVFNQYLFPNR